MAAAFVGCLAAYAWAGWRLAQRLLGERLRGADGDRVRQGAVGTEVSIRLLAAYVNAAGLLVVVMAGLGGFGMAPVRLLSLGPFLLATAVVLGLVYVATRTGDSVQRVDGRAKRPAGGVVVVVAITIVVVAVDLGLSYGSAPTRWDAMTYHLFFPARWLQESTILHVPTVFGDNAAAFAPQNGAVLFAWSMLMLGSDAATNVLQLLASGSIAVGVYFLARRLDVSATSASLVAILVFFLEPLRKAAFSADVDAWMVSFFIAALALLVHSVRDERPAALIMAGLATGLVAGTKTLGSTLALLPFLVAAVIAFRWRRLACLAGFLGLAVVGGGFWYVTNLVQYQNPLFPLDFGIGPLRFAGAYDVAAVRAGEFHLRAPGAVVRHAIVSYGLPTVALLVAGGVGLATRLAPAPDRRTRALAALLLLVALVWSLWFLLGVPHNTQTRFLLPAAIVLLPGLGPPVDWLLRRNRAIGWAAVVVAIVALCWTAPPVTRWRDQVDALAAANVTWQPLIVLAAVALAACAWAWILHSQHARRRPMLGAAATASVSLVLLTVVAVQANEDSRIERFARSDFASWAEAVHPLHESEAAPATIAYSGANVPYILTGRNFRHRVLYVNTRGTVGDGFFEHWQRDGRQRYAYHKPGIYRHDDDPSTWHANLRRIEPTLLVLFELHPFERRYLPHTPLGFPPESEWAANAPERFEYVTRGESSELLVVRPRGQGDPL